MREIEFKAWWKDTKKFIPDFNEQYTIETCSEDKSFIVRQFTGLKSFQEVKIFDGDYISAKIYGKEYFGKIVYNEKLAGYYFKTKNEHGVGIAFGGYEWLYDENDDPNQIIIQGNEIDNPELEDLIGVAVNF